MVIRLSLPAAAFYGVETMQTFKTQVIHRPVKMVDYAITLGFRGNRRRRFGVVHMLPTAWTLTRIEAALFVAVVLGLAGAGTWVSVIG